MGCNCMLLGNSAHKTIFAKYHMKIVILAKFDQLYHWSWSIASSTTAYSVHSYSASVYQSLLHVVRWCMVV